MTREYEPLFDAEIAVELLDTETGERVTTDASYSPYWWAEGNGSCDCNRRLQFANHDEEDEGRCEAVRYLIVGVEGNAAGLTLWEFNDDYPPDLVEKHLGTEARQEYDAKMEENRLRSIRDPFGRG